MPRYVVYLIRYVSTIRIVYRIKCITIRIVSDHPNDTQPYCICYKHFGTIVFLYTVYSFSLNLYFQVFICCISFIPICVRYVGSINSTHPVDCGLSTNRDIPVYNTPLGIGAEHKNTKLASRMNCAMKISSLLYLLCCGQLNQAMYKHKHYW